MARKKGAHGGTSNFGNRKAAPFRPGHKPRKAVVPQRKRRGGGTGKRKG